MTTTAMRDSFRHQASALEDLLADLERCKGEADLEAMVRAAPHPVAKAAVSSDEDDLANLQLSSLASVNMEGKFAIGQNVFAK